MLRYKSKPLQRGIDRELKKIISEMLELMYEDQGAGLAANQVDLPYRLFVMNIECDPEAKDQEHVFINPVISRRSGMAQAEEGCLSLPEVYGQVRRPEKIVLSAYDLSGEEVSYELDGLFARAAQHEVDHLDGSLFIDRLGETGKLKVKEVVTDLELQFEGIPARGL
jgi:peptide deformylase